MPKKSRGPTSRDLARLAGVSQSTVSRVLANDPGVGPELRAAVERAAREINYTPNAAARAMRLGRSGAVGVLVTRVTNPLHAELLLAIGRELHSAQLEVVLWNLEVGGAEGALRAIRQGQVDGVLVTSAAATGELETQIVNLGRPTVLVHRGVAGLACDQVLGDSYRGAFEMAQYFARGGRKSTAIIAAQGVGSALRNRVEGFVAGAKAVGLRTRLISGGASHNDGVGTVHKLMRSRQPPDSVFAASDMLALGALDGARAMGIAVPDDLWIAGSDDIEMAGWQAFGLTTIHEPIAELARESVALIKARVEGSLSGQPPRTVMLGCPLVVRGSTAPVE